MIRPTNERETPSHGGLIDRMIESQQQLTAVERFSQRYETATSPVGESLYRDLIPLTAPEEGEQYSFEIDLDACSGCKACVAACHNLNGLEEGELWRNVGLLTGGEPEQPQIQHITSACHHCLEPACMLGCPVNAYEKDAATGIVEHLDDQCIGCKYCMFTCPYDVPSYSPSKGIVRKCNMCIDRLRVNEAPACVASCPNQAIKIRNVSKEAIQKTKTKEARADLIELNAEPSALVPGAPSSQLTSPSTAYLSSKPLSPNLLPQSYFVAKSSHAHYPLVFMLTLTQMAFGIFAVALVMLLAGLGGPLDASRSIWQSLTAPDLITAMHLVGFGILNVGLGVATLHLGRPQKAYRAMAGWRTSWLSREIIGFNLFAAAAAQATAFSVLGFLVNWFGDLRIPLGAGSVAAGSLAVVCSAMLYVVTGRPLWSGPRTHGLFFLTAAVLGTSASMVVVGAVGGVGNAGIGWLILALIASVLAKLAVELKLLIHRHDEHPTPRRLASSLLLGEKKNILVARIVAAVAGGVLIPVIAWFAWPAASVPLSAIGLAFLLFGELAERYLFFAVSVSRQMPGAPNQS